MNNNQTSSSNSSISTSSSSSNSSSSSSGSRISISGELTSSDSSFVAPNDSSTITFADEYELATTAFGQPLTLSLLTTGSTSFDPFLQIINANTGDIIASDNDGGDGLNSLISGNDLILQPELDYLIRVNSFGSISASEAHNYNLQASVPQGSLSLISVSSGNLSEVDIPVADISVGLNSPDQVISLSDFFVDFDGDESFFEVVSNSNSNLVNPTLNAADLNLDFQNNQSGTSEIIIRGTDSDRTVEEIFNVSVNSENISEGFDVQYYRLQNNAVPGTYIYVDGSERDSILANPNLGNFVEEGNAFKVRSTPGENLVEVNRYQSSQTPGTYVFSTSSDFQSDSRINQSDFVLEGVAFYAHGANSGSGNDYYRFENNELPGTYLFTEAVERSSILTNFPVFEDQGTVWAVEA